MADDKDNVALMEGAKSAISAGMQLMQIRTEKQLSIAQLRPRDSEKFEVHLLAEAAAAGEDFFYSIPYKDHREDCQDRRRCDCPSKPVEGPGVGLARSAARTWGNCSVDTTIEQDNPDHWLVGAWFIDFETNFTKHETKRVSKMKTLKGGRAVLARDRDLDNEYQKGASKVERDVIIRSLPRHVIEKAFEMAKKAALMDKMPVDQQIARLLRRFQEIEVSLAQIEKYLGCAFTEEAMRKAEKDPRETCAELRGLITAIKGGEVEVAEVFNGHDKPAAKAPSSAVTMEEMGAAVAEEPPPSPDAISGEVTKMLDNLGATTTERNAMFQKHKGDMKAVWRDLKNIGKGGVA